MKPNLSIYIIVMLFLSSGCNNSLNHSYLKPTTVCKPLSAFDILVISPLTGDSVFVEETQYKGIPKDLANATNERLKEYFEENRMFAKTIISTDCADKAIKIDCKLNNLSHRSGRFHTVISGKIINCQTGETLYRFENDEADSQSFRLPDEILKNLSRGIRAKMDCW